MSFKPTRLLGGEVASGKARAVEVQVQVQVQVQEAGHFEELV